MFDRGRNVGLEFALGADKAVANATAISGYDRAQSNLGLYGDFMIKISRL